MRYHVVPVLLICSSVSTADVVVTLPKTSLLTAEGDLADQMMDGLHRYAERRIVQAASLRGRYWQRDFASAQAYEKSIEPNRRRLRHMLGVVEPRVPVRLERWGDDDSPALVARNKRFEVYQVRWPALDGVWGEGLLLEPLEVGRARAQVIAVPDADILPEQLAGLVPGLDPEKCFARRLAENGIRVIVPALVDRSARWSGNDITGWTNQPHREWLYRQAYHMGRHVLGYELQRVLALVDWFEQRKPGISIGLAGHGEGGLLALLAAAVDTRVDACLVSGYFDSRPRPWEEPIYRNVFGLQREFGDAEIATLIAPRGLVVEYSESPAVSGPPALQPGRKPGGAVGKLTTPPFASVEAEYRRLEKLLPAGFQKRHLEAGSGGTTVGPGSRVALHKFVQMLGMEAPPTPPGEPLSSRGQTDPAARQQRLVREVEQHVQRLVHLADHTRAAFFPLTPAPGPQALERFVTQTPKYRQHLLEEVLGKLDETPLAPNPRTRRIYEREKWVGYEVVLDVFPDVFAWGVLLLPRDLKPGERRPVVVCQHGRNGVPKDVIEGDQRAYHDFAARLAERGFITFAPHNPYRGEDRYRILNRKANATKATLFSFILAQHQQILNWLETLPHVDPERIAFYGLSYGGETAVRVPPLLERYCLSICSADFNHWTRKVASTETRYTFMNTIEWEMPYFNMGSTFDYAELAALMLPRPFMVERGHADGVGQDEWVAHEYAKVRRLYVELGLAERTEIEFFRGGHTIHGQGTFEFLHRHLWR